MKRKLLIEFTFTLEAAPSKMAEQDIRDAVADLGNTLAYLGKVTRCDLESRPSPEAAKEPR